MAVGAVMALPAAGWFVGRFGSRRMTSLAAIGLCVALPLPILSPTVPALSLSLLLLGACNGTLDVSMNAQAVLVERRYGRAIMSSFHALFSLGGLVGAGIASVAIWLGAGASEHVTLTAMAALAMVLFVLRGLVPAEGGCGTRAPAFARPRGALVVLGVLAFFGLLAEGAMADWSAVYLRDGAGSSPAVAAAGFALFSLAMAAGRFGGDRLVARFGASVVLRLSAAVASCGLAAALLIGRPLAGVVGCGLVGLGIANVIPVLFSGAARVPGVPAGTALAGVATTGYLGLLAGPPLIGLTAELITLRLALGIVSAFCALIALYGGIVADSDVGAAERAAA
jgi:fucose permease